MINGTVRWFDNTGGEGMISCEDGNDYYCHWSVVKGDFPAKHNKKSWVELLRGWKVEVKISNRLVNCVVEELHIIEKTEDKNIPSAYNDRPSMKAKLAACEAMFSETFPEDTVNWGVYHKLSHKPKLNEKEQTRLSNIESAIQVRNELIKKWNRDKSMVIVAIYRDHSKFELKLA